MSDGEKEQYREAVVVEPNVQELTDCQKNRDVRHHIATIEKHVRMQTYKRTLNGI